MTDKADREPLNHETVWQPLLDDGAIERILEQVGLSLQEGVSQQAFAGQLHFHISEALDRSIVTRPRQARAEIEQLRECIWTYLRLRRRLRELGLDPPTPPAKWRGSIVAWLQEQERILDAPSQGGRYPEVMNSFVVPGLLGLFQAAFGQRPTSTTARHGGQGRPAARFIGAVIAEVRCSIEQIGFDLASYGPERGRELTLQWTVPNPDQLEQMIRRGLRQRRPAEEPDPITGIGRLPERLEWEVRARFFESQLGVSPQG